MEVNRLFLRDKSLLSYFLMAECVNEVAKEFRLNIDEDHAMQLATLSGRHFLDDATGHIEVVAGVLSARCQSAVFDL